MHPPRNAGVDVWQRAVIVNLQLLIRSLGTTRQSIPRLKTPADQNVRLYRSPFGQRGFSTAEFFSGTVSVCLSVCTL